MQYEAALQYQSGRVSEHFAITARESSDRMEQWTIEMHKIAVKTEQETVSMHVITIFTLVFLPGTFLAVRYGWPLAKKLISAGLTGTQTFFSSGVFHWDEDGSLGSDYVTRSSGMVLFFAICVPMMIFVMAVWALFYWLARRKRKHQGGVGITLSEKHRSGRDEEALPTS
jgi:hypothetical protein